jgi:hypothetical protein
MNLAALQSLNKKYTIKTEDGDIELSVKGYSLSDLTQLMALHTGALSDLYLSLETKDATNALVSIVRTVPDLINDAICLAIGLELTSENLHSVSFIPAYDQIQILTLAGKQTFRSEADLKEFMAVAGEMVAAAVSPQIHQQPSSNGSGNLESKSPSSKRTATKKRGATQSA